LSAEKIFSILRDEDWHSLAELAEQTEIEQGKIAEFLRFLDEKAIVRYDGKEGRVKMEHEWSLVIPDKSPLHDTKTHQGEN